MRYLLFDRGFLWLAPVGQLRQDLLLTFDGVKNFPRLGATGELVTKDNSKDTEVGDPDPHPLSQQELLEGNTADENEGDNSDKNAESESSSSSSEEIEPDSGVEGTSFLATQQDLAGARSAASTAEDEVVDKNHINTGALQEDAEDVGDSWADEEDDQTEGSFSFVVIDEKATQRTKTALRGTRAHLSRTKTSTTDERRRRKRRRDEKRRRRDDGRRRRRSEDDRRRRREPRAPEAPQVVSGSGGQPPSPGGGFMNALVEGAGLGAGFAAGDAVVGAAMEGLFGGE
ncbi:unnamed protein product [Amoebophrya sp. A120]|nr:unnamed protein product [Amoebophrya sp. A120]|eukprot:GSA120T00001280001.1